MFYVQHGFGKASKIPTLEAEASVRGVVLSPAHEDMVRLAETADDCRGLGLNVLLDPQSFIYSLTPQGIGRQHPRHDLEFTDLQWSQPAETLQRHINAVRLANDNIGNSGLAIAPSPYQASLTDYWTPVALQYARTASSDWGSDRTLASIVIDENVLRSWEGVQEWLDVLTTLDVQGFYLLVNRSRPLYPPVPWEPQALANLMRVIYTLTDLNGYDLIWGYADIDGLLGIAVGATAVAAGWSYGLRGFSVAKWNETRSGGAAAVPRIHVSKLWTPIRNNEAEDLFDTAVGRPMFSKSLRAHFDRHSFDSWGAAEAQHQHLSVLATRVDRLGKIASLPDRLDAVEMNLEEAIDRFAEIAAEGITLEGRYVSRLRSYREAVTLFRASESL